MDLQSLLSLRTKKEDQKKIGISEERIEAIKPVLRQYIAFWREYPDLFVDFMNTGADGKKKSTFKFYFYQRLMCRIGPLSRNRHSKDIKLLGNPKAPLPIGAKAEKSAGMGHGQNLNSGTMGNQQPRP